MFRWLAVGSFLVVALAEAPASAQDEDDDLHTLRVVTTIAVGLTDVGFLAGDIYYGAEGDWLPLYAAWTQTVLIGPANLAMAIWTLDYRTDGAWLAAGIAELVFGVGFMVHGTLSIMGQPDEPRGPPQDEPSPSATVSLVPLPEGGVLGGLRVQL